MLQNEQCEIHDSLCYFLRTPLCFFSGINIIFYVFLCYVFLCSVIFLISRLDLVLVLYYLSQGQSTKDCHGGRFIL